MLVAVLREMEVVSATFTSHDLQFFERFGKCRTHDPGPMTSVPGARRDDTEPHWSTIPESFIRQSPKSIRHFMPHVTIPAIGLLNPRISSGEQISCDNYTLRRGVLNAKHLDLFFIKPGKHDFQRRYILL